MLDTMAEVMKAAYDRGWISTRDGNVSLRRQHRPYLYITPGGACKNQLTSEHMLKLRFPENIHQPKAWTNMTSMQDEYQDKIIGLKPSGELPMHYLLQKNIDSSNRVVVHLHPTHIVAAMYAGYDLRAIAAQFLELNLHTRVGPSIGPVMAQSQELGEEVYKAYEPDSNGTLKYDLIGIHLHGVVAVDRDPWQAYLHIERMNHVCEIVLAAGGYKNTLTFN
jgi:L-fuculose-phosphate aldolase